MAKNQAQTVGVIWAYVSFLMGLIESIGESI